MTAKYNIIKQEHLYPQEQKLKFLGEGEWVEEFDNVEIEYRGYEAHVLRVFIREPYAQEEHWFGGHLCGYVKIPKTYLYYDQKYEDIDCHGGVTFDKLNDDFRIMGFDCAHLGDYIPSMELFRRTNPEMKKYTEEYPLPQGFEKFSMFNSVYRNMDYCLNECIKIIDQLIEKG